MPTLKWALPVGISFYTFQAVGYAIDVWRGKVKAEHNLLSYALFVTFFPQLVAGPIERTEHLLPQLKRLPKFDYDKAVSGLRLCLWGMVKKVIIADTLAMFVEKAYNGIDAAPGISMFVATVFFAFQVLCDFSGYSDIAVGVSRVLGYDLMQNFDRPYLSHSVGEFWRRWHISLSSWLRDYVYIPLGGNRKGRIRTYINLMITFLVSGLWHGAAWHFVVWGAVHGALLVAERMMRDLRKRSDLHSMRDNSTLTGEDTDGRNDGAGAKVASALHIAVTFVLVVIAWVFFRSDNVSLATSALRKMMQIPYDIIAIARAIAGGKASLGAGFWGLYTLKNKTTLCKCTLCMVVAIATGVIGGNKAWCPRSSVIFRMRPLRWAIYWTAEIAIVLSMVSSIGIQTKEFLYFQF